MTDSSAIPKTVLEVGFFSGLLLAFLCFLGSAYYLHQFQQTTSEAVRVTLQAAQQSSVSANGANLMQFSLSAHIFVAQVLLRSCGVFAGLAFGFLGFSLFLIGVQGDIDADLDASGKLKVSLVRLSPGALVIVVSAILIGFCAVSSVPGSLSRTHTSNTPQPQISEDSDDVGNPDFEKMDMQPIEPIDGAMQEPNSDE